MRRSRRHLFARAGFLATLLALNACEETKTTAPADAAAVVVSPAGPLELAVGDTLTLRVGVTNAPSATGVVYATADSGVVRVTSTGFVSAIAPGTTSISVSLPNIPAAAAVVVVEVIDPLDTPPTSRTPSVSIEALQLVDGTAVDNDSVAGTIFVRLQVERGNAARFQVLIDSAVACAQDFTVPAASRAMASAAAATLVCPLNTARYDTLTGAPSFPNGGRVLVARLVGKDGSALAQTPSVPLALANHDRLLTSVSTGSVAPDSTGRSWRGGVLTIRALPVLYGAGARLTSIEFSVAPGDRDPIILEDGTAPFEVTLAPTGTLRGVTADSLRIVVTGRGDADARNLQAAPTILRYDAAPPPLGTLQPREWVGRDFHFDSLYSSGGERDRGVGGVTVEFFAGDPALEPADLVAGGTAVEAGADLPASRGQAYELAARVCDALSNCAVVTGFRFGVDLTPPSISSVSVPDRAVNPTSDVAVTLEDAESGFGSAPLLASVTRTAPGLTGPQCGPDPDDVVLPGHLEGGTCAPDPTGGTLRVPEAAGYYTYSLVAQDRAGNRSGAVTRTVLVDRTPPALSEVVVPGGLVLGQDMTVEAQATDDLDLLHASAFLVYPSPQGTTLAVPFAPRDSAGAPFDGELVTRLEASWTMPFVGSLSFPAGVAVAGARTFPVRSVLVRVRDVAGLAAETERAVTAPSPNTTPFAAVDSVHLSLSRQNVCSIRCIGTDPTTATADIRLIGPLGFTNPFAEGGRVYFFVRDADGKTSLVGSTASSGTVDTGTRRVTSISLTYQPPAGITGGFMVFAVGVNRAGAALYLGDAPLQVFGR